MARASRPLKREKGRRATKQRFLIYCEGEVTEREYFEGYRQLFRSGNIQIKLGADHAVPLQLVNEAISHQSRAPRSAEDKFEKYDQVWCVMDVEAPTPHPNLEKALSLARKNGIRCAISNPCFEIWLILHFAKISGYATTAEACKHLEAHNCGYSKESKHIDFKKLQDRFEQAKKYALDLEKTAAECIVAGIPNPSTDVYKLIDQLISHA
ncbi:RloB family protein [Kitasatospora sp. NPDC058965]|uniref:RloB family protein n=1 Tax=Kitasatospora sp. NPDC058965 TaxID=3346682 RepID=UPI0036C7BCE1